MIMNRDEVKVSGYRVDIRLERLKYVAAVGKIIKFEVEVFWGVTPCAVAVGHQRFEGPCCLHLQGKVSQ